MKTRTTTTSVRLAIAALLLGLLAPTLYASVLIEPGKGTFSDSVNTAIPDRNPTGEYAFSGVLSDYMPRGAIITGVDVYFRCVHPYSGDLTVDLMLDSATTPISYRVWNREGGSADNPARTLSRVAAFNGRPANGQTWFLKVQDWAYGNTGYIDEWSITIYYWAPIAATYSGLCLGSEYEYSGPFTITTTTGRKFSAKGQWGTSKFSFSGSIGTNLWSTNYVMRTGLPYLTVALNFSDPKTVTGTMTDGSDASSVTACHNTFNKTNPAVQAGKYNVVFYRVDSNPGPPGYGYGTVQVSSLGQLKFSGVAADGSKVTQATYISDYGNWPLCVSMYGAKGSTLGWLTVSTKPDIRGNLSWHKPSGAPGSKLYPDGFDVRVSAAGLPYVPPANGTPAFNYSIARLQLEGGDLPGTVLSVLTQVSNNKFTDSSTGASLSVTPATGLLKGSFIHPQTGKKTAFSGMLYGNPARSGYGFFLGPTQSGRVYLSE